MSSKKKPNQSQQTQDADPGAQSTTTGEDTTVDDQGSLEADAEAKAADLAEQEKLEAARLEEEQEKAKAKAEQEKADAEAKAAADSNQPNEVEARAAADRLLKDKEAQARIGKTKDRDNAIIERQRAGGMVRCKVIGPGGVFSGHRFHKEGSIAEFCRVDADSLPQLQKLV